ncbi:hypothetical protein DEU56DRAFT_756927 [Suillus clintonianus]|uniref:uncharacterized protein n=1 Tax=Suillus clintonianus TaxID=1904413 RepID=UPI001B873BEA|nr:uncharacterized protein DEU56DRAFT_756927 [Suillus clintonianus]KAG2134494.1 hypothetical protein DEU56DRAFT_756927 [Suillus clintonianus]
MSNPRKSPMYFGSIHFTRQPPRSISTTIIIPIWRSGCNHYANIVNSACDCYYTHYYYYSVDDVDEHYPYYHLNYVLDAINHSVLTTTSPTTSATTSTTPSLAPSTFITTSGNQVVTSITYVTASSTPSSANNTVTSSNSFFSNTGAVAGVFTVVGLVVVAIFVALLTNAVRRRRAKRFDRDVAEAAAEAAATSRSPFDDYTYSNNGGSGGGGYPYSDTTHGTFGQAPMGLPTDTYGMSEMTQYDPYAAGAVSLATANVGRARSRQDSETRRAPGIAGVGAGNLAREPSRRLPYHAFAGPGPQPHETIDHTPSMVHRPRGGELLEAAGLAGTGVAAMTAANNGAYINRRPSEYTQQTHGSMRSRGHSSNENHLMNLQPAFQPPPHNDTQYADAYTGFVNAPSPQPLSPGFPNPYETSPSPPPAQSNHHSGDVEGEDYHDDGPPAQRLSYADDEDYGQHNRVLRVANE